MRSNTTDPRAALSWSSRRVHRTRCASASGTPARGFPRKRLRYCSSHSPASSCRPPATTGATPRMLLYVEDNPANLELVEDLITRRPDLRMLSAGDGNLGIALAREFMPAVILMDINLPGISGIEAMTILRADPATAHIPIVAISANAMPNDIKKGLQAGFFRYLTKPLVVNEFMDSLGAALEFSGAP